MQSMNVLCEFALQGAVGFAIGAGTNDLAIRWVFWALFAKKKQAIANAVQTVVSKELMSPDKIAARLASPEVSASVHAALLGAVTELAARPLPSLDALARQYADLRLETLQSRLAGLAADVVAGRLAQPAFRDEVVRPFLESQWGQLAACRSADLLPASTRDLLAGLPERLADAVLAPEQRERLCTVLADGVRAWMADYPTPATFLGGAHVEELTRLAGTRTQLLGEELAALLATPPAQSALLEAIRSALQTQLNTLGPVGSLLGGLSGAALVEAQLAKFCATLPSALRAQLAKEAEALRLQGLVEAAVRKLLGRTGGELLDAEAQGGLERHFAAFLASAAVRDMARHGFAGVVAALLESVQRSRLEEVAARLSSGGDLSAALDWSAAALHNALRSAEIAPAVERQAESAIRELCQRPLGAPDRFLPDGAKPRLAALLAGCLTAFARDNVEALAERTRIFDIISESIIVYDEKKMEQIARSVANRELRWVTLSGGIIGLVVGIVQGLLLLLLK